MLEGYKGVDDRKIGKKKKEIKKQRKERKSMIGRIRNEWAIVRDGSRTLGQTNLDGMRSKLEKRVSR